MPFVRPSGRWQKSAGVALALTAVAVLAQRAEWRRAGADEVSGGGARAWIWADTDPRDVRPRAFFAISELELEKVPTGARLEIQGDEEYLLWINGRRAGSGAYESGAALDLYDVASLLRAGSNRVAIELRSATGSGAVTLRLTGPDGRVLLQTGPGWRIFESARRRLLDVALLPDAAPARVLGHSPFGRWGDPPTGELRPLFDETVTEPRPRRARRFRRPLRLDGPPDATQQSAHGSAHGSATTALGAGWLRQPRSDEHLPGRGALVEFDFGREVTGFLTLSVRGAESAAGLLRFGDRPVARDGWMPDAVAITVAERGSWQAARARRFRYVAVAGLDGVLSAAVLVVDSERTPVVESSTTVAGLLGIAPPPRRLPVVDATWKRIRDLGAPVGAGVTVLLPETVRSDDAGRTPAPARAPGARRRPGKDRAPGARGPHAPRRAPGPRRASPPGAPAPESAPAPRG